jgi:hypothetical protein
MHKKTSSRSKSPASIDGERLARAARSNAQFSKAVWFYRGHGFSDREIIQAITAAKTVISPPRRGGAK